MLRTAIAVAAVLAMNTASAAGPIESFFHYDAPREPVAGDCDAIAAAIGRDAAWYGEFSGNRYDNFSDQSWPYGARGCFKSEYACRVWQQQSITCLLQGTLRYTFCRPLGYR